jgi:hypothetical protein
MNMDPRIGQLNSGLFYAFINGYDQPEVSGTRQQVEAALGLDVEPETPVAVVCPLWDVKLSFQYPAWDEQDGLWYRGIEADSKAEANAWARKLARDDGHLSGGQGRLTFTAHAAD